MLKTIFVILHVITAAGWFGIALIFTSISKRAAESPDSGLRAVGSKAVSMMGLLIVLTLVFGVVALFLGGGFGAYGPTYHTSLLLILILVAIQFFVIRKGWLAVAEGAGGDASGRRKIAMGTGIGHLIWLVVLVLMFWRVLVV